jgi:hypothetical protein
MSTANCSKESIQKKRQNRGERAVTADEAEQLLSEGWQYAGSLPNGKVIVKR